MPLSVDRLAVACLSSPKLSSLVSSVDACSIVLFSLAYFVTRPGVTSDETPRRSYAVDVIVLPPYRRPSGPLGNHWILEPFRHLPNIQILEIVCSNRVRVPMAGRQYIGPII